MIKKYLKNKQNGMNKSGIENLKKKKRLFFCDSFNTFLMWPIKDTVQIEKVKK